MTPVDVAAWLRDVLVPVIALALCTAMTLLAGLIAGRLKRAWTSRRAETCRRRYEPVVRAALDDADTAASVAARNRLRHIPRRDRAVVVDVLLNAVRHVRGATVARARMVARDMGLLEQWRTRLRSGTPPMREAAARALGFVDDVDAVRLLLEALSDRHGDVRAATCDALGAISDPRAVDALVACIGDPFRYQPVRVVEALRRMGSAATASLVDLGRSNPQRRAVAADVLAHVGGSAARAALLEWTADEHPDVAAAAWRALVRVGLDERASYHALRALRAPDASVRAQAARAIAYTGRSDFVPYLIPHLDDEWEVATQGARALARLGGPGVAALRTRIESGVGGHGLELARQLVWESGRL